ncbi:MAG TPA: LysR family transcriptional regulator, partial [Steroidobacteraceae bacterium]|nr:LysR family transcriptional regulator [Steroidobacteraceae bacterium]
MESIVNAAAEAAAATASQTVLDRLRPSWTYPETSSLSDIKLKDLRYLVAVADARHFGRAAERCFVSQPTLSAQLKKL